MGSLTLNLVDGFWTFQGEGKYAGSRALFIRMPHCNLKCPWCDTKFDEFERWTHERLSTLAGREKARFAVITGGEPMMNKQTPEVVEILKGHGFLVACETNGTFPIVKDIDFVTCSPKRFQKVPYFIHDDAWQKTSEFKYVVDDDFDFNVLNRHDVTDGRRYSLSPEYTYMHKNLDKIFAYIKENPGWKISLQTHKVMRVP